MSNCFPQSNSESTKSPEPNHPANSSYPIIPHMILPIIVTNIIVLKTTTAIRNMIIIIIIIRFVIHKQISTLSYIHLLNS